VWIREDGEIHVQEKGGESSLDERLIKWREDFLQSNKEHLSEEAYLRFSKGLRELDQQQLMNLLISQKHEEKELEKFKEDYLKFYASVSTKEQYAQAKEYLDGMTFVDLVFFRKMINDESKKYENMSEKERLKALRQIWEENVGSGNRTAKSYEKASFMADEDTQNYLSIIEKYFVQDYIHLTAKEDRFLIELWEGKQEWDIDPSTGENRGTIFVPSDLFFAKTIALRDVVIEVDERNDFSNGTVCKARVIIFDDYKQRVENAFATESEEHFEVGIFVGYDGDFPAFFIPLYVCPGYDFMVWKEKYGLFPGVSFNVIPSRYEINGAVLTFFETWYGIQIALLHPDVKDVFKNPQRTQSNDHSEKAKKKKRRVVRYVRKHIITLTELEEYAKTEDAERKYHRKCLVWHVIGHWRTYKNGTRVFIQPHWRGVLRQIKTASNVEARDRELSCGSKIIGRLTDE